MIAAIPQLVVDLTAWFGFFAAVLGVLAALNRTPIGKAARWVFRRLVAEPFEQWVEDKATGPVKASINEVQKKVDETDKSICAIKTQLDQTDHYVRYHLGPNTDQPALYQKIDKLGDRVKVLEHQTSD